MLSHDKITGTPEIRVAVSASPQNRSKYTRLSSSPEGGVCCVIVGDSEQCFPIVVHLNAGVCYGWDSTFQESGAQQDSWTKRQKLGLSNKLGTVCGYAG